MEIRNTKQLRSTYEQYNRIMNGESTCYRPAADIHQAYGRPSDKKTRAWERCVDMMKSYDGHGIVILGHNCMTFSVGFIGYINGLKHFFYITRDHDRALPLEKMDAITGEVTAA